MFDLLYSINVKSKESLDDYIEFIKACATKDLPAYVERHHILPKSLFPQYAKDKTNVIKLSAQDHFKAHILLAKAFGGKMWLACDRLSHNQYGDRKISPEEYEQIQIARSLVKSEMLIEQWNTTRSRSDASIRSTNRWANAEYKAKTIKSMRLVSSTDEFKGKCKNSTEVSWANPIERAQRLESMAKVMQSSEYKEKHSNNQKERMKDPELRKACGWNRGMKMPKAPEVTCPNCNKVGISGPGMNRYHFNNCKFTREL